MNPDIFAEWLVRQGHQIFKSKSSNWVNAGPGILQAFPYDSVISPEPSEINELFKSSKSFALRYSALLNHDEGMISYHVVYEGDDFALAHLPKKVRHDIQHGMDYCEYKPIDFDMMETQGWRLRKDTLSRQGRTGAETKDFWSMLCRSAEGLPGFEAWGAVKNNELIASIFTYTNNGVASILYQQSLTGHLKYGINNTLAFVYTNYVLANNKASRIFYGLNSLDAPASVDEFKFRMGFAAKPIRQRVVFNPLVAPLFNPLTHAGLRSIHKLIPGNPTIAKAEGMVRFYLEGKLPLEEQQWPEVLLEQKESILAGINKG